MPRLKTDTDISGSICNYITATILHGRTLHTYGDRNGIARIWENTADNWNHRVLRDWGW